MELPKPPLTAAIRLDASTANDRPVLLFLLFWPPTRSIDVILKSLNFFFLLFCPPTKSIDVILKSLNFAYRRL